MSDREEYREYQQYVEDQITQQVEQARTSGASEEELAEYASNMRNNMLPKDTSLLGNVSRGLDYLGGVTRTAAFAVQPPAATMAGLTPEDTGIEPVLGKGDVLDALKGNPLSGDEILGEVGMPEGLSRTGLGLLLEMGTDPGTYIGGVNATTKLGKLGKLALDPLTAIDPLLNKAGKKVFSTGLKKPNEFVDEFNKGPVSDTLWKHGISGTARSIRKQASRLARDLSKEQRQIVDEIATSPRLVNSPKANSTWTSRAEIQEPLFAREKFDTYMPTGAHDSITTAPQYMPEINTMKVAAAAPGRTIGARRADVIPGEQLGFPLTPPEAQIGAEALAPAQSYISALNTPRYKVSNVPDRLQRTLNAYIDRSPVSVRDANRFKSDAYRAAKSNAYKIGSQPSEMAELYKSIGHGYKEAIEGAADKIGKGDRLREVNDDLSRLLTAQKSFKQLQKEAANKNWVTSTDPMFLFSGTVGGGMLGDPVLGAALGLALKKGADLSKTTWLRTGLGRNIARSRPLIKRTLIDETRPESPWSLLRQE